MAEPLEVSDPAGEGAVDWDGAAKFFTGGNAEAGNDEGNENQTSKKVTFSIKGKKIEVSPEEAAALEELRKQARGENGRLGSELAATKERLARLEGVLSARQIEKETKDDDDLSPPDPRLAQTDFAAWQKANDLYHAAQMDKLARKLEMKYAQDQQAREQQQTQAQRDKEWADQFYSTYEHLDDQAFKPIVSQVYVENKAEIDALRGDTKAQHERLAELADARLVQIRQAGKQIANTNRPPRLESSAGAGPRSKGDEGTARVVTAASWSARERARMRGEALQK